VIISIFGESRRVNREFGVLHLTFQIPARRLSRIRHLTPSGNSGGIVIILLIILILLFGFGGYRMGPGLGYYGGGGISIILLIILILLLLKVF
jgi:hypothetical protein